MLYAKLVGTGSYLPEGIVTNQELAAKVDTSHDWIVSRTGIEQRHVAGDDETASSMATQASLRAIEASGIDPNNIDLIVCATSTPDKTFPSTACYVQKALNISNCAAFDVSAACAGYVYAVSVANQYIKSGAAKTVLVIGSEVMSRLLDWTDRGTCILFGDGAGATIFTASEQPGILSVDIHADSKHTDLLYVDAPQYSKNAIDPFIHMSGNEVFKVAVTKLGELVDQCVAKNNLKQDDIHWLVPHQANMRILKATAKKLNMSMEQVIQTVDKHANTSAASIPLALDHGIRAGKIKKGQNLLLDAFGAGFTWGAALLTY